MAKRVRRKNESLLDWLRAVALTVFTLAGLLGMGFEPFWGAAALAVAAGVLGLLAADLGVIVAVVALSLPMVAVQPVLGIAFVLLGVVGVRYLGSQGGRAFLVVGLGIVGAFFGPAWAAAAIAGWMLGIGEGALAAALTCLSIEALGIALGKAAIGATVTGGSIVLLDFSKTPNLFEPAWVRVSFSSLDPEAVNRVIDAFAKMSDPFALAAQPVLWALGAAVAGMIARRARERQSTPLHLAAAAAGVAVPAAGTFVVGGADPATVALSFLTSAVVAGAFVVVGERWFPYEYAASPAAVRAASVAAEDADVDELLRLISTAEDKLASQHTLNRVVMITDMKSFSRMTEEDGSVLTAKAIQRHRDLLLPVIERNGGHGKSTGGDGLVAAFEDPKSAVIAAAEIQRTLDTYNSSHPGERDMTVRVGIAQGEVVLDKGGRPFIGAALNLAARVMNLADGGQSFAAADVIREAAAPVPTHSHGDFELKNIAQPVEVVEILWGEDQVPVDPRTREG